MKLVKRCFFLFIFVLPVLANPYWYYAWELPKILVLIGFSFSGLILFFGIFSWKNLDRKGLLLLFLWWLGLFLASYFGVAVDKMMWGGVNRWQGIVFYLSLIFLYIELSLFMDEGDVYKIGKILIFSALITIIIGGFEFLGSILGFETPLYAGRIVSSFGQPNFWAGFLLLSWLWWGWERVLDRKMIIMMGFIFLGIVMSGSRLGILLFIILAVVKFWGKKFGIVLSLFVLLIYSLIGFGERIIIWKAVWGKILLRPFRGYGVETMGEYLGGVNVGGLSNWYVDRAHNVFLDMAFYGGILTLALFVSVLIYFALKAYQKKGDFILLATWIVLACFHVLGTVSWVLFILILWRVGVFQKEKADFKNQRFLFSLWFLYFGVIVYLLCLSFGVWILLR
jgi:hypothetical protein